MGGALQAQTTDDIGKVRLCVAIDENADDATREIADVLGALLTLFCTEEGYASFDSLAPFLIQPKVVFTSEDVAEGGMKSVYVVKGSLYVSVIERNSGTVFASSSVPFHGTGTSKARIAKQALSAMDMSPFRESLGMARAKILKYYSSNRDNIFKEAEMMANRGDYDAAIATLLAVPTDLSDIYAQALDQAIVYYNRQYEAQVQQIMTEIRARNSQVLQAAENNIAQHNATVALQCLWDYEQGNADQDSKYQSLLRRAEALVAAEERAAKAREEREYRDRKEREAREERAKSQKEAREWAMRKSIALHRMRMENREMDLQRKRIEAVKAIACEYYRSRRVPTSVMHNTVIISRY